MSKRRRTWLAATVAVVAAAAVAAGLLAAWPRPTLEQPTGLAAVKESPWSITLGWEANAGGLRPAGYEILENGRRVATVPARQTSYQVAGLKVKTSYQFTVVAVSGTGRSVPSSTLLADTAAAPPVSEAAFAWTGYVTYKETFSSDIYFEKLGATWQDDWSVSSDCGWQACGTATVTGSVDNIVFTAHLTRSGATYQGSAPINDYWLDCEHQNDHENTTLYFKLTATRAAAVYQQHWTVTAFTGYATWDVPALPDGCSSSLYKMKVSGVQPVAGIDSP
jgi:Fibronectin type III domain